jgi:hypothetical protein
MEEIILTRLLRLGFHRLRGVPADLIFGFETAS